MVEKPTSATVALLLGSSGGRTRLALLALMVVSVAASSWARAHQTGDEALPTFERRIYPFEVVDETGQPYAHPFLGGLNIPRPQLVDIDGDGDLDLLVQEYSNEVMLFEQVGTPDEPRYVWRTDRFRGLEIGEWSLFVDMDADGDLDLLAEEPFSLIRYYRNDGGRAQPSFTLVTDRLKDVGGEALFSDRQNIPKVADIDCDRRLDLMLGRIEGTITRYEQDHVAAGGAPVFRKVTDHFQSIEIIGQILLQRATLHGANTMALEDIDGDGDLDLFWGDFFEPGLLFIRNTGSCSSPALTAEPVPFPPRNPIRTSGYNAPAFGDLDADGDRDLLLGVLGGAFNPNRTTIDNLYQLDQIAPGRFALRTARYLTNIDVGSESFPAFADLDGDGDLDLLLGNKIEPDDPEAGRLYRFENVGTSTEPSFRLRGSMEGFVEAYHYAPAFADLDDDGDIDMLMGSWRDKLALVTNVGTISEPHFVNTDPELVKLTRGRNATPTLGDVDGDGDLDLFIGESSGKINYYRNQGTPASPRFELVSDEFAEIDVGRRSVPTLVDLDGDGDLDLVIGSEANGVLFYRNTGTRERPRFEKDDSFTLSVHPFTTPTFADIDGDGDADFFAGGIGGGLIYYENRRHAP
ncbi:MAG: FG-GAP-like repeat-containing protein [Acidobacteriota bacterium]